MAPVWSGLAAAALVISAASAQSFGVMAYPAGEARLSKTCFANGPDDPFTCGWYCGHAFYVETDFDGAVTLTPFGIGNDADNAYCSDCSLFEGEGAAGDLLDGGLAEGVLAGGYKWDAYYDSAAEEMIVNFTDYEEPCNIRYVVMEGEVMGVAAASGRPATENTQAILEVEGWGGPPVVCQESLAGCLNWDVYVEGDVADWQSLDEADSEALCPSRVTPFALSNDRYMGHDGAPRGVDSWAESDEELIVSDRNTIISFQPFNLTRCELYFGVVEGCFQGLGPACYGASKKALQARLPSLAQRMATQQQRLRGKQQVHARAQKKAGRLPMQKPRHVAAAAWTAAMAHEDDFALGGEAAPWYEGVVPHGALALAGWALSGALVAGWLARRKCGDRGYKAIPQPAESSPLLSA